MRRRPITSGGLCPAPASVILRRAGSQYAKRAVAERAGSVSRSSSSRSDRTATGSSPSITAYARREARSRPIAAIALGPDPVTAPTARPSAPSGSGSASYQSPPPLRTGAVPGGELDAGDPGQPGGQQFLGDGRHARARARRVRRAGPGARRRSEVQADEVPLALDRLGGLVVEPDGGAQAARRLRGERQRVAGGVAEPGGDLAVAGVEPVLGEEIGL